MQFKRLTLIPSVNMTLQQTARKEGGNSSHSAPTCAYPPQVWRICANECWPHTAALGGIRMNLLFLMDAVALFVLESLFVFVAILSQGMTNLHCPTWATYHLYYSSER